MTAARHLTARQIANNNKREREALAARLDIERSVADGPFDSAVPPPSTVDDDPALADVDPYVELAANLPASPDLELPPGFVVEALRQRLAVVADAPPPPDDRFAPDLRPRIVDGLIVPAVSVELDPLATWVLIPIDQVATIGRTGRAVGITPKTGRWLPVWVGDDQPELAAVFAGFAGDYATARRSR